MTDVAITGLGLVTPHGIGAEAVWAALGQGPPALTAPVARAGVPAPRRANAWDPELAAEEHADPRTLRKVSALSRLATVAATRCLAGREPADPEATGVVLGTCFGSAADHLEYHQTLRRDGLQAASALLFAESVFNAASSHLAKVHGLRGAGLTLVGGETVGLDAVAAAVDRIRQGAMPAALAGGVEAYSDLAHAAAFAQGVVGDADGPPYGAAPLPLSEGAALLWLARGPVDGALARIAGVGRGRRGRRPAGPEAAVGAARRALADGGCRAADVDLVIGGAAGGPAAAHEAQALACLFGARAAPCWLAAPKGVLGEGLGAGSALLAAVGALALSRQQVPPTWAAPEPPPAGTRLAARAEPAALETALVLCCSGPGAATALLLRRP